MTFTFLGVLLIHKGANPGWLVVLCTLEREISWLVILRPDGESNLEGVSRRKDCEHGLVPGLGRAGLLGEGLQGKDGEHESEGISGPGCPFPPLG